MTAPCPCGRSLINATNATKAIKATKASKNQRLPFAACCGPYLNEGAATLAVDAETLMRSRYSAFVLGRRDYLLATWHASTRPANLALDFAAKWLGLEVLAYTTLDVTTPRWSSWRATARAAGRFDCMSAAASCGNRDAGITLMGTCLRVKQASCPMNTALYCY